MSDINYLFTNPGQVIFILGTQHATEQAHACTYSPLKLQMLQEKKSNFSTKAFGCQPTRLGQREMYVYTSV